MPPLLHSGIANLTLTRYHCDDSLFTLTPLRLNESTVSNACSVDSSNSFQITYLRKADATAYPQQMLSPTPLRVSIANL